MNPLASIIIVNRNGIEFVDACLKSVFANTYPDFEVIFVDNGSDDESLALVQNTFGQDTRLRIIENKASLGPAVGRNRGIASAKGDYIAFLDNDTEVDRNWLTALIKAFEADSTIGAAQSKLLRIEPADEYDYAGDYLNAFGFLTERARGAQDTGQFDFPAEIFSAKSASCMVRKTALQISGGFDESYYMYLEETDFCWRIWLAGYRVMFLPESVVHHAYGTRKKAKKEYYPDFVVKYYGCRNYITTLWKNLSLGALFRVMPLHIASWLALSAMFLVKGKFRDSWWIVRGVTWNLFHIVTVLKKRHLVQKKVRAVSDSSFMPRVSVKNPLSYYMGKAVSYLYGRAF
ncbi:MAG TPA: glycosyltransferase family 2 protein [Candidatus Omnitrophota bacterium]|nr:glycosyltransferase family 2 protein [Candidatus Omnitrophota bacterium]HPT07785.1 glycosyltransferase family 2 protein [Candidatus Omnitrophota bacterium]